MTKQDIINYEEWKNQVAKIDPMTFETDFDDIAEIYLSTLPVAEGKSMEVENAFRKGHKKGWLRGADGHSGWENKDTDMYLSTLPKAEGRSMEDILNQCCEGWPNDEVLRVDALAAMKQWGAQMRAATLEEESRYHSAVQSLAKESLDKIASLKQQLSSKDEEIDKWKALANNIYKPSIG